VTGASEPKPVARGKVAVGDRHEACQARLGCEQVIAAWVETAFDDAIADREKLALGVEEKVETHFPGHRSRRGGKVREAMFESARESARVGGDVAQVTLDRSKGRMRPRCCF